MHLKNFSLVHTQNGVLFSPAYDLLNVNLIFPGDKEELALTLAGRKTKIKRSDFDQLAASLEITDILRNNVYKDFSNQIYKAVDLINRSFLNTDYKEGYITILNDKFKQLGL